jgi:hypothetical protein
MANHVEHFNVENHFVQYGIVLVNRNDNDNDESRNLRAPPFKL